MNRVAIVAVLILSLIGGGATRQWADNVRGQPIVASSGSSLSGMNSYALALLLGGLRGPLVMFLWSSSESQKSDNDLEDFDSKVEWIRLLQPEFDTVHIFQIWNKAYNISVKMTNLANKYATILDALDYAHKVDAEKPNDINIISDIGLIYYHKLGDSAEKVYYRQRVRTETQPHATDTNLRRRDSGVRRTELDPILDANHRILPELLAPRGPRLVDPNDASVFYDGSELQFLAEFDPYNYGVSPFAIAYNYDCRAQRLQMLGNQRHAQMADLVIDSRPALDLHAWALEEADFGRRAEMKAFGRAVLPSADLADFESSAGPLPFNRPVTDRAAMDEAIYEYDRAAMLSARDDNEFAKHITRFRDSEQTYVSHREIVRAEQALYQADADYLKSFLASPADRPALLAAATLNYAHAANLFRVITVRYSVNDDGFAAVFPKGVTKDNLTEQTPQLIQLTAQVVAKMEQLEGANVFLDDAGDYLRHIDRASARLKILAAAAAAGSPAAPPNP